MNKQKGFDLATWIAIVVFAPITLGLLIIVWWLWAQGGMAVLIAATFLLPALLLFALNLHIIDGLYHKQRRAAGLAVVLVPLAWLPAGLAILQLQPLTRVLALRLP